jgi:hypothetical protein
MRRLTTILGYTGAAMTGAAMLITPFVLFGVFTQGVAATGIRINTAYSGGEPGRTIARGSYNIVVNRPVFPRAPLTRAAPFVQLAWTPASALPAHVTDGVDLDGDGRTDLIASFDVPADPRVPLHVDVTPTSDRVLRMRGVSRDSFSSLIARVGESIVVRVPLAPRRAITPRASAASAAPA